MSVSTALKHPVNGGSHRYLAGVMTPGLQRRNATSSQHVQDGRGCEHEEPFSVECSSGLFILVM